MGSTGETFRRVAEGTNIDVLLTPVRAPQANAICEPFWGNLRRVCLDYFVLLAERHLGRIVSEYVSYFNNARPHQGVNQQIPCEQERPLGKEEVIALLVLGELHHDYRRVA